MSETTGIEWATSTGNPWIGCTKVSPGCKECYAEVLDRQRFSKTMGGTKDKPQSHWGPGAPRVRTKQFWKDAVKWEREKRESKDSCGIQRPRIFPSLCDWLDPEVPIEWLADFLKLIHETPNLDWLLLTKRPKKFFPRLEEAAVFVEAKYDADEDAEFLQWLNDWIEDFPDRVSPPDNVWIGVSVEDQARADERIPELLKIPAAVRFLSVEPLLEQIWLELWINAPKNHRLVGTPELPAFSKIDWVIVGGESGPGRRDCGVMAIADVAQQCRAYGVPVFVKQDCALRPGQQGRIPDVVWGLKQFPENRK